MPENKCINVSTVCQSTRLSDEEVRQLQEEMRLQEVRRVGLETLDFLAITLGPT